MPTSDPLPRQWDIVVVPFPYADQLAEKRRPALVVSSDAFNRQTGLLLVAMITSNTSQWVGDVPIGDHTACGLPVPSTIRSAKIATIEAVRVLRVAGQAGRADVDGVRRAIRMTIGEN
jgi:mRNA interferase MazF